VFIFFLFFFFACIALRRAGLILFVFVVFGITAALMLNN
jgi:hypothetical protein